MQYKTPRCFSCKHYEGDRKCKAYKVIPEDIFFKGESHRKLRGDEKEEVKYSRPRRIKGA